MNNTPLPNERKYLIWVDCEMTGLDLEKDELIEIALQITDYDLNILDSGFRCAIKPSKEALDSMTGVPLQLNTDSGLMDVLRGNNPDDKPVELKTVEQDVLKYIKKYVPKAKVANLAGNSIGIDAKFLAKYMPEFYEYLHYQMVDVSTFKVLLQKWAPKIVKTAPKKLKTHKALDDIRESIAELQHYRNEIFTKKNF